MASTEITKVVHIETGDGERTVKSLRQEINDLRDALLNMDKGGEDWVATARQLTQAQNDLNDVMRASKGDMDAASDSIVGMEQHYKSLYNTYRLLSEEARNSAEGLAMQKELAELSKNLNTAKKDVGNFKDNIGHYAEDVMGAFGKMGVSIGGLQTPLKIAAVGAKGLGAAFKSLIANPVGAVIMAIVVAFKALKAIVDRVKQAIASNEEYQLRMNKAMAAFKPIGDLVAQVFDKIAGMAVKLVEGLASAVTWVTNLFNATKKLAEEEEIIAEKENEIIGLRREAQTLNAEDNARVQTLLEEASAMDEGIDKQEKLLEAKEKQEAINKRNIELAQAELDLLVAQSKVRPNSIEDNNKIAAAEARVNEERAKGEQAMRRINRMMTSNHKATMKAANEELDKVKEILKRVEEDAKTEVQKLSEKYEEEKKLLEKYHKDTTELTRQYNENLRKLHAEYLKQSIDIINNNQQKNMSLLTVPSKDYYEESLKYLNEGLDKAENFIAKFLSATYANYKTVQARVNSGISLNISSKQLDKFTSDFTELINERDSIQNLLWDWVMKYWDTASLELPAKFKERFKKEIPEQYNDLLDEALGRIYNYGGIGDLLEKTFGSDDSAKDIKDFFYNFLNPLTQYSQEFIEQFNAMTDAGIKSLSEVSPHLRVMRKEVSDTYKTTSFYIQTLDELDKEYKRLLASEANIEKYEKGKSEIVDFVVEKYQEEERALKEHIENMEAQEALYLYYGFENEQEELEFYKEFINAKIALDEFYLEKKQEGIETEKQLAEREHEINDSLRESAFELAGNTTDAINSMANSISDYLTEVLNEELKEGKISKQEIEKKKKNLETLEKIQRDVAIAGIAADAASGIMGVWKSYGAELALNAETAAAAGPAAAGVKAALDAKSLAAAILKTAGLTATATAAITATITKSISNLKSIGQMGEDSSSGSAGVPQLIDSTPYSYTRELQTNAEREERLNTPIYVRVTDINEVQNRVRVTESEATF